MKKIIHYSLFIIHFFLFLMPTYNLMGQTAKTWTGATNTNWHSASNWNPSGVPQNNDPVTIPNVANDPVLGQADTVASLTLQNAVPVNFGGYTLTVTNTAILANANLSNGQLVSGGISSNGATVGVRINNTAGNVNFVSSTFSKPITATGSVINLNTLTFNDSVSITKTGTSTDQCTGGITANSPVNYTNGGAGSFLIQSLNADVYNSSVTIRNLSSGVISFGRSGNTTCNGKLTINSTGGVVAIGFHSTGTFNVNADIEFSCSNTYTIFEKFTLQPGKKILPIAAANFNGGNLDFKNGFNQLGTDSITINGQNGARLNIQGATTFRGVITANVPSLKLNGGIFHGKAFFTKTGSNIDQNDGGYTFLDDVSFTTTAGTLQLAYPAKTCTYNGNLTLSCTGGTLSTAYVGTHNLKGNLIFAGTLPISLGGAIQFTGTSNQTISRTNSVAQSFEKLVLNKPSGTLNLEMPVNLAWYTSLNLTNGNLVTTNSNILTFTANSTYSGGSASSYIEGPVIKFGTTAFTFPTGRNGHYKPISISAPATNSTFIAEYTNKTAADGRPFTSKDASINRISSNEHWQLQRTAGTANVQPTVTWDNMSCQFDNMANLRLTAWNGSTWKDLGNGGSTGTTTTGTIKTTNTSSIYGYYTLATTDTFRCVKCEADAGEDKVILKFNSSRIGKKVSLENVSINWLPNSSLSANNLDVVRCFPMQNQVYTMSVNNSMGCVAKDDVYINVIQRVLDTEMWPCVFNN